jgi:hypothetical protein
MEKCVELPVARRRTKTSGKVAATKKGAAAPRAATPKSAPPRPARPAKPAPKASPPPPPPAEAEAEERDEEASGRRTESSSFPNLAPIVPGLDSVVIPAPLEGLKKDEPVSDPDGVLDSE